jgi:hypothetical protein
MINDFAKEYIGKVNAFNNTSFYGANHAKLNQAEQDRTEFRSAGGLNYMARDPKYWEIDNPHTSAEGNFSKLNDYGMWNTKYEEVVVNKLQYTQLPQMGYNRNYWVEHLLEIEEKRAPFMLSQNGNGNMTLTVDNGNQPAQLAIANANY